MDETELQEGECYFLLLFYHPKIEIPLIDTYLYIGKNINNSGDSENEWFFQDPTSYVKHGSYLQFSKNITHKTLVATKDTLAQMYNLQGLIRRLNKIKDCKIKI